MVQLFMDFLTKWSNEDNQRTKLQKAYFCLALLATMVAGLTTLINVSLGQYIIILAAFLTAVYFTNAIAWALLDALVIKKLEVKKPTPSTKKR